MGLSQSFSGKKKEVASKPWTIEEAEIEAYKAGYKPFEFWKLTLRELTAVVYANYEAEAEWFKNLAVLFGAEPEPEPVDLSKQMEQELLKLAIQDKQKKETS